MATIDWVGWWAVTGHGACLLLFAGGGDRAGAAAGATAAGRLRSAVRATAALQRIGELPKLDRCLIRLAPIPGSTRRPQA